jgi:hypothetical protein
MSRPKQGGYTVEPPQKINTYYQWRLALNLSIVEFVIPKSKAIKQQN